MQLPRRLDVHLRGASHVALRGGRHAVQVKRASERPLPGDGMRVLVDRRWPPGLSKERVSADLWLKDAAPSDALFRLCAGDLSRWDEFKAKYRVELAKHEDVLRVLDELRHRGPVTLLHSSRDRARNSAVALRDILEDRPPARRRARNGEEP